MNHTADLYRTLFDEAPDAMLVLEDGEIVLANAQAERLYGYAADELVGAKAEQLLAGRTFGEDTRQTARSVSDRRTRPLGTGLHLPAQRKDGTSFTADLSLSRITGPSGEELTMSAVRDASSRLEREAIGKREVLEEHRERAGRLESLGQLAGGIAHDFNNLLGVILNYATLLEREVTDPTASGDLAEIRTAAERAAALTRQLLTFARRDVVDPEPLDVNAVIRDITELLGRTLGGRVGLRLRLAEKPLVAVIDRHQLDQVVLNLAINARDAMSAGGALTITTRHEVGDDGSCLVVLTVTDDGEGMAPDVAERAFEPFFSTKPKGAGTGLGLSTVYGIVQQNRGDVTIESTAGLGTSVTVVLPCATETTPVAAEHRSADGEGSERILLVEDEQPLREATARLLQARGYDVVTAGDGIEALDVMDHEERPMDLVVTDVAMPRLRGDELAERLAVIAPEVPVLFVSGFDSGEAPLVGRLLPKPVAEQDLLRAVREVLDG
ncbi:MAG: PAS domain S-box protein [Acidimicrobiia bacterium]|nr:PAS domain S-box protein [Acidimicrobiia bacterium]